MQGQAVDIRIHAEEMRRMANRLYEIYSKHTGQPADVIGTSLLTSADFLIVHLHEVALKVDGATRHPGKAQLSAAM